MYTHIITLYYHSIIIIVILYIIILVSEWGKLISFPVARMPQMAHRCRGFSS